MIEELNLELCGVTMLIFGKGRNSRIDGVDVFVYDFVDVFLMVTRVAGI